jgi:hypothetical protein
VDNAERDTWNGEFLHLCLGKRGKPLESRVMLCRPLLRGDSRQHNDGDDRDGRCTNHQDLAHHKSYGSLSLISLISLWDPVFK